MKLGEQASPVYLGGYFLAEFNGEDVSCSEERIIQSLPWSSRRAGQRNLTLHSSAAGCSPRVLLLHDQTAFPTVCLPDLSTPVELYRSPSRVKRRQCHSVYVRCLGTKTRPENAKAGTESDGHEHQIQILERISLEHSGSRPRGELICPGISCPASSTPG